MEAPKGEIRKEIIYMNLTTTEKYALAVFEAKGKMADLQKDERGICLVASCLWDMIGAGVVAPDEKGRLKVTAALPETLDYCNAIYEMLGKKPVKPEKVVQDYMGALTDKRIRSLVESIAEGLARKGALTLKEQGGLHKTMLCHVNTAVLMDDMAALKNMDGTMTPDQLMMAVLLLKSGVAKKLMSKEEITNLKEAAKRDDSGFQPYVKNMITVVETAISSSIAGIVAFAAQ